ncbi:MAG: hypothetical protein ACHP83_15610 [Burkholderiales bacterium]
MVKLAFTLHRRGLTMTAHRWSWRVALATLCLSALPGCVVAPLGYYNGYYYNGSYYNGYYGYGYPAGEALAVSDVAPPAPYYEVQPAIPYVGAVWFSGYWNWYGGRYVCGRRATGVPGAPATCGTRIAGRPTEATTTSTPAAGRAIADDQLVRVRPAPGEHGASAATWRA